MSNNTDFLPWHPSRDHQNVEKCMAMVGGHLCGDYRGRPYVHHMAWWNPGNVAKDPNWDSKQCIAQFERDYKRCKRHLHPYWCTPQEQKDIFKMGFYLCYKHYRFFYYGLYPHLKGEPMPDEELYFARKTPFSDLVTWEKEEIRKHNEENLNKGIVYF